MTLVSRGLAVLFLLVLPVTALAQGLGDAAARERQKREKQTDKPASRVYTDEDLLTEEEKKEEERKRQARSAPSGGASESRASEAAPSRSEESADAPPIGVGPVAPVRQRAYEETGLETKEELERIQARGMLDEEPTGPVEGTVEGVDESELRRAVVQGQAGQAQTALKDAQEAVRPIQERIDAIQRELSPLSPNFNQDPNRILQLQADLTSAQKDLEAARKQLDAAQKGWESVLDAARRAGVPASELTPR